MSKDNILKEQLIEIIQKALRAISSAKKNLDNGDYDFSSSRAYYAAFYSIEAVLLTKNLTFSKHGSVIGEFNKNFIKNGIFPKEFSKLIFHLFRQRQTADYEFSIKFDKNEALKNIEDAEKIITAIIEYLKKEKFIDTVSQY